MAKIRATKTRPGMPGDVAIAEAEVKRTISADESMSVLSNKIFGVPLKDGERNTDRSMIDNSIYNKVGYIELPLPVMNYFLASEELTVFNKLLQLQYGDACSRAADIAAGKVVYDLKTHTEIKTSGIYVTKDSPYAHLGIDKRITMKDLPYSKDILIGAQYLEYLVKNINPEELIKDYLVKAAIKVAERVLCVKSSDNVLAKSYIIKSEGDPDIANSYHVLGEYYYVSGDVCIDPRAFDEAWAEFLIEILNDYENILIYLFSLRDRGMDVLMDQVQYRLFVLPYGYRQNFKKRKDKLTKMYNTIVASKEDLSQKMRQFGVSIEAVRIAYGEFVTQVKKLTVRNTDMYDKDFRSIFELVGGKKGHIRERMMGVRTDYSGRAVIVVDPNMSVDTIGIPKPMALKLMELHILKKAETTNYNKDFIIKNKEMMEQILNELFEDLYAVTGRQPTLYRHGLQAFKAKIVDGNAIVLNPLACPAFNADFDGDQMHISVPVGEKAIQEVKHLMANTNNLYLSKSGKIHAAPRQEIIYGLWLASKIKVEEYKEKSKSQGAITNPMYLIDKVCDQTINIYDTVNYLGRTMTVGEAVVRACLPEAMRNIALGQYPIVSYSDKENSPVTEDWCKDLLKEVHIKYGVDAYVNTTNNLVKVGFAVAEYFPPAIPVVNVPDINEYVEKFDAKIKAREELYYRGFETSLSFSTFYDTAFEELSKEVDKIVKASIPDNSGFKQMMDSGARGSMKNLRQMFGMKGRIQKNSAEIFNTIIKTPTANQLSGLEHSISAYGARHDLIDKSINTFKPGYLSRRMGHASSMIAVVATDCGDTEGLLLDFDFIKQFINPEDVGKPDIEVIKQVESYITKILLGRFVIVRGQTTKILKTEADVKAVLKECFASIDNETHKLIKHEGVRLRSPLTCKNPCCVKCYGKYDGTQTLACVGLPIGSDAATSIGEPGTQMTMKNFQGGGVAGQKNLTSSFDLMNKYLELGDLMDKSGLVTYDYLSPVEGKVKTVSCGDGTKRLIIYDPADPKQKNKLGMTKIRFFESTKLKDYVHMGEPICTVQGQYNIKEVIKYRGIEYAQKYLCTVLYNTFVSQSVEVNFKHFEVLIASMTFYICTRGNDEFKTCHFYTPIQYAKGDKDGAEFTLSIKGLKQTPRFREDVFSTIFLEDIKKGIHRSIIVSGYDSMTLPIVRYAFGLKIGVGTGMTGDRYLEERTKYEI